MYASTLADSTDQFYNWVNRCWPNGKTYSEMPITLRGEHGEIYQGYIDFLIETEEGFVIIDHKTHSSKEEQNLKIYAANQIAQLQLYRRAVEEATGKKVLETMIHFPVAGKIYRIAD
ncbi:MAG: PD-(D/E)XK nuclease family protein [Planctomycetia bacterium]|nr:PD-(D/E)XK nuclease family protein [Planctomycetia bacterium]